jgi:hypothetical protein
MDANKQKIVDRFVNNVLGKKADTSSYNQRHDGKAGHWLEVQMGIDPNAYNDADLFGYEMKNQTKSKTTFGDWSANEYIYKNDNYNISRDDFIEIFGQYNNVKDRYSWSGKPTPKVDKFNEFGQKLVIDNKKNIIAEYSYSKDKRVDKATIIPPSMQVDNLEIAKWSSSGNKSLREKVENKFDQEGFFICKKDSNGVYNSIQFGDTMNFDSFIENVKNGDIYFDSGMYQGNNRPYSQWRANNSFWNSKITQVYPGLSIRQKCKSLIKRLFNLINI